MKKTITTGLMIALLATTISCKKTKEEAQPDAETLAGKKYTVLLKTAGSTPASEVEYLIETDDLMSGEINAEEGIEQIGWRYGHSNNKTVFVSGYQADNLCAVYSKNSAGDLYLKTQFAFGSAINILSNVDNTTTLGIETIPKKEKNKTANYKLHFIDASFGTLKNTKLLSEFYNETEKTLGYPTALLVRGDKLYIPFIKYDEEGNTTNPVSDTAFVAVYSYPEVKFEKYIKDGRTGYIGTHGATTGLIKTSNGTIYSSSSTSTVAGMSVSDKQSGILRINNGSTEFDKDYFFNVEAATGGEQIFRMHYIGGNKVFARLITSESQGSWATWTAYSRDEQAFFQKGVIIDLEAKTVTDIANLPLHASRWTAPIYQEDGKLYLSIETYNSDKAKSNTDAYIYQVDIASATAKKGAKINGKTVKGIFSIR